MIPILLSSNWRKIHAQVAECRYPIQWPEDCRPKSKRQYAALFRDRGHIEVHSKAKRKPSGGT
jgi:hypothetical protein